MRKKITLLIVLFSCIAYTQNMRNIDKIRIAEAIKISNQFGDQIWKGFNTIPFTLLLVTDDYEYLMNHPNPSEDFKLSYFDTILNTNIYYRKTVLNKHFLATFPAVNGKNCIVVGTPENTNKNSSEWVITLVHEHFHHYVYASNNYYKEVETLDLAKGDTSGMWMLNYPFKYDNDAVAAAYNTYTKSLYELANIKDVSNPNYKVKLKTYNKQREEFVKTLSHDDYKYFSFQLWQEGIARYTEIKFLELMTDYKPNHKITTLADYVPFNLLKDTYQSNELNNLIALDLKKEKRICFYSVGLAEGLILDKMNKNWRDNYLKNKFFLEQYK